MRVSRRALIAIAAAVISIGVSSVLATPAYPAAGAPRVAVRPAATGYSTAGGLNGAAAVSSSSAWAVGYAGKSSAPKILMLRWNGKTWSRVTSPRVLTATGQLTAITVASAKSAWAVGYTGLDGTGKNHSLLLHWNGAAWSQVASTAVTGGSLAAVTATAKRGWAVGYVNTNPNAPLCCAGTPLVFRWNGAKWSRLTTRLGKGSYLDGVASTGTNGAWAIGGPLAMITGGLAKWNGSAWSWVKDPVPGAYRPFYGIAAGPGGTAFVVGTDNDYPLGPAISARWTGKAWRQVSVIAPNSSGLNAVAFAPGGTAWAAGSYPSGARLHTLIMRWNGKAWTRVTSPGTSEQLNGLAFAASNYGWAVGSTASAPGSAKTETVILHWNGKGWA